MPHPSRPEVVLACSVVAVALGGCGNSRSVPADVSAPAPPGVIHSYKFPSAGVSFRAPADWAVQPGHAPLVAAIGSGDATVAIWRYRRREPLPVTAAALAHAQSELIRAAKARDRRLRVIRAAVGVLNGVRSVTLSGTERIDGRLRRVRSIHLYAHGAEVVLDSYAPMSRFHAVDHSVFSPLGRSLRLSPAARA